MGKIIDIPGLKHYTDIILDIIDAKASNDLVSEDLNGLMSSIDKYKLNYTNIAYGTCSTGASTAEKVINLSVKNLNWELKPGSIIIVKFSYTNSASNPKLNVNGTGAIPVIYNTSTITSSNLSYAGYANRTIKYVYNGTSWVFIGWSYNTAYSSMTATEATNGTSTSNRVISPKVLNDKINSVVDNAISSAIDTTGDGSKFLSNDGSYKEIDTLDEDDIKNWGFALETIKVEHSFDETEVTITPNKFHIWNEVEVLDLSLDVEIAGIVNEYFFQFGSGDTATTLILPDNIKWIRFDEISPNKTYQCSIINNIGILLGV